MTLLICPVAPGEVNEQLRYALRSWEKNLLLGSRLHLITVGHKPSWLEPDDHVEGNLQTSPPRNVWDNIRLGSERCSSAGFAIYMNDDFFCMDPVLQVPVVRRNMTLEQHAGMYPHNQNLWFVRSLRLTARWLAEAGFPHPASYDLHRPLPASPGAMYEALSQWQGGMTGDLPQWRSLYGNLMKVEALPVADVKLGTGKPGSLQPHSPWVSTSDAAWRKYGKRIAEQFPKPSRWEKS